MWMPFLPAKTYPDPGQPSSTMVQCVVFSMVNPNNLQTQLHPPLLLWRPLSRSRLSSRRSPVPFVGLSGQVVDVCSPPKKAAKTRATSDVKAELAEDSEPNGIIAAAVIPPELSSSPSRLDSAHAVEVGPVGSPMDVASQETTETTLHDPMDDLSQELERLMDDDETS